MIQERARLAFLTKLLLIVRSRLRSQARLQAEILVLRQQVLVLTRKRAWRVRLGNFDRLILVWLCQVVPSILESISVVKPETVLRCIGAVSEPTGIGSLGGSVVDPGLAARSEL